jgi:hypothetical protein
VNTHNEELNLSQVVRAFLGLTPDNLLLNKADVLMRKSSTVDRVDSDKIEEYFQAVEDYTQAVSEVAALAYNARSADMNI